MTAFTNWIPRALLVAGALCAARAAGAQSGFNPPCHLAAAGCDGMPRNTAEVVPGVLYRGSQPSRAQLARVQARHRIKTVVDLRRFHSGRKSAAALGLDYLRIPSLATHAEDEDVGAFLRVVADPARHPVFVHCRHGADRTGLMIAAYRLLVQQPPPPDAEVERELRTFDFHDYRSVLKWIRRAQRLNAAERAAFRQRLLAMPRGR